MKSLHKIQSDIPEWAKRMILLWSSSRGSGYKFIYLKDTNELGMKTDNKSIMSFDPCSEYRWRARGWILEEAFLDTYSSFNFEVTII